MEKKRKKKLWLIPVLLAACILLAFDDASINGIRDALGLRETGQEKNESLKQDANTPVGKSEQTANTPAGKSEQIANTSAENTGQATNTPAEKGRSLTGAFETVDLDGSTVTEDIFSKADVTFVNVWGTFCPPCIGEMPELEKIHQELPDNFQMIGILFDVKSQDVPQYQNALEIVEATGVTYPSLIGNDSLYQFLRSVHAVPTSFFVDSEGCIIGSPVVGADPDTYRLRLEELSQQSQ